MGKISGKTPCTYFTSLFSRSFVGGAVIGFKLESNCAVGRPREGKGWLYRPEVGGGAEMGNNGEKEGKDKGNGGEKIR